MKAVFFDRDGVLNEPVIRQGKPYPPASVEDLIIVPTAKLALQRLKKAGFLLIGVTNQPDVARGMTPQHKVEAINEHIIAELSLDAMFVCFHDEQDNCTCRKPKPGMLITAAKQFNIDTSTSFLIGDRWKDIDAGQAVGCFSIWIDRGYDETKPVYADMTVKHLNAAVSCILHKSTKKGELYA